MTTTPKGVIVLLALGVALALVLLFAPHPLTLENLKTSHAAAYEALQRHPVIGTISFMTLYIVTTAASIPGAAVLTLAAGALFGFIAGTIIVSLCSTAGATLAFLVSRHLLRDWVQRRYGRRLAPVNEGIAREGAFYLFALRLIPAVPFFLVNLLMGLTPLPTKTFFFVSQLGMLPGTMAYVFAGTRLAQIRSVQEVLAPDLLLAFAIIGLLPLLSKKLLAALRRGRNRREYNLVVIGAGSAGLSAAYVAQALKAKVALVERDRMGGDCLNTGCVPSKALIKAARVLQDARRGRQFGLEIPSVSVHFNEVMERIDRIKRAIEPHDSEARYRGLGVDVYRGEARVLSPHEVQVGSAVLTTANIILATGATPATPPIKDLDKIRYLTSDTLWELRELPRRLVIVGGGPIACELGQCFQRFGAQVTLVQRNKRLLPKEDDDAVALVEQRLRQEGVQVLKGWSANEVIGNDAGGELICFRDGASTSLPFDRLLIAAGRKPNVRGCGLDELGITLRRDGSINADPYLATNYSNIFVCGDVTGPYLFTHAAAHQASHAVTNALFGKVFKIRVSYAALPRTTFTDPELAHVGLTEREAHARGVRYEATRHSFEELDRAVTEAENEGFVKVLTPPGKDKILGCTIVGPNAGELLAEFVLAMRVGIGLKRILTTVHAYPTLSEINKYVAGDWRKQHVGERVQKILFRFNAWQR